MSHIRSLPRVPRAPYLRVRDLAKLLPLWPAELEDTAYSARQRIVSRLHAALRHERRKGIGAHWDYDINRHAALMVAFRAEVAALQTFATTTRRNATPQRLSARTHSAIHAKDDLRERESR